MQVGALFNGGYGLRTSLRRRAYHLNCANGTEATGCGEGDDDGEVEGEATSEATQGVKAVATPAPLLDVEVEPSCARERLEAASESMLQYWGEPWRETKWNVSMVRSRRCLAESATMLRGAA